MDRNFHIALSRPFDLDAFDADSQAARSPRHLLSMLRHELKATVHQPEGRPTNLFDKAMARAVGGGTQHHWALARELADRLGPGDVIYCAGEDIGFRLAALLRKRWRPRVVVQLAYPQRRREQWFMRAFDIGQRVDLFLANTANKTDFVRDFLRLPPQRTHVVGEQTDVRFFTPGPVSPDKPRPLISGCGLEQREYITLAEATRHMDLDVKICAVSPNATGRKDTFPEVMPSNMVAGYFAWPDLAQLYRDSDLVSVTLKPNAYQAGLTVLMEALACKRPVIMTRSDGLMGEFEREGCIIGVPAHDDKALKRAIERVLAEPEEAAAMAQRGYDRIMANHTSEAFLAALAERVRAC